MVMKHNAMSKNLRQSIIRSMGRYIAIAAIIALGAGLFVGLLMTKSDMVATGQKFMDEQNMFDLRLVNSYGWTEEYLDEIASLEGVEKVDRIQYLDLIGRINDAEEDSVYRFMASPQVLNLSALRGGRLPENETECLITGFQMTDKILGSTVTISEKNTEDALEGIRVRELTIVGYVAQPLYMDMNRGTTNVGSGTLTDILYVDPAILDLDYFQEINLTLVGDYQAYTDEYSDAMKAWEEAMEPQLQQIADRRLEQVRKEACDAYADGLREYSDGEKQYLEGKAEAEQELRDAEQKLLDGEQELLDNEQLLKDGEKMLDEGLIALEQGDKTLQESKQTLANSKAGAYKQLSQSIQDLMKQMQASSDEKNNVDSDLQEVNNQLSVLNAQILPLETQRNLLDSQVSRVLTNIDLMDTQIRMKEISLEFAQNEEEKEVLRQDIAELQAQREEYEAQLAEYEAQRDEIDDQLEPLYGEQAQLEAERDMLQEQSDALGNSTSNMAAAILEMTVTQAVMEQEFAAADAQIEAAEAQIKAGYLELDIQKQTIEMGWKALEEGRQEIAEGWEEYEKGKLEAEEELRKAKKELDDGARELTDAWLTIQDMTENEIMVLDRSSNIGYNNLDSSSDIVQGVSRVIPVFFLLVASLVCITTMTRMIDEERTQIGTLKALGYTSREIISKYLLYSGSGAIIGCGLGIAMGCTIFPSIIWQAYKIMLYITDGLVLTVNWLLAIAVVAIYTAVLLFVTWYCCYRTLGEQPAELIRPKSPDPGKKLLIENLPFWHRISFLNKVTIRNIFRYRQRLAMMMVGIGGCTALLLTGFGLRDSIVNVVDYQFQEVTLYDLQVYFQEGTTPEDQESFLREVQGKTQDVLFYHQSSVELVGDEGMKEIYMICADEGLTRFIDFHTGTTPIPMPESDQVVLSVGVAEAMDIETGDTVTLRSADMEVMELTVSGIYDNHVYNYCIVSPEAIQKQWHRTPEQQMALIQTDGDVHALAGHITELSNVMNVAVSDDLAEMVGGMMDALDLVVWVIVFCAGLLAVIVLYNLTNININERIREIATIKVLGFNAAETGAYVFKENLVLTVAGSIFGLGLGYLMLVFVMTQIKIDMVWFKPLIMGRSYLISIVLTILSAIVVDFIFYFKLDKINMAEALKSVE